MESDSESKEIKIEPQPEMESGTSSDESVEGTYTGGGMADIVASMVPSKSEEMIYKCKLDPRTKTSLHLYLYKDVVNVEQIRKKILSGSWKCSIIKPCYILDPLQIVAAANIAVLAERDNKMTTRNVYTEILYNLSLSKNIAQSLSMFGIEKDTDMYVCFLVTPESKESERKEILNEIKGEMCKMGRITEIQDMKQIMKAYKIEDLQFDPSLYALMDLIISRMATKNIISF